MKKEFNIEAIVPKLGFKIAHKNVSIPEIGDFETCGYKFDFDVFLETKGCNLQRPFCWTLHQKREFILSLIKEIPINVVSIVVYKSGINSERVYKIIDGKQRLCTALSFIKNEFSIVVDGEEYYYNELVSEIQNKIFYWSPTATIAYSYWHDKISDNDLINWFNLLNFAGTPQEEEHRNRLNSLLLK